jgi:hypothetical protein
MAKIRPHVACWQLNQRVPSILSRILIYIAAQTFVISFSWNQAGVSPHDLRSKIPVRHEERLRPILCMLRLRGGSYPSNFKTKDSSDFDVDGGEMGSEEAEYLAKLTRVPYGKPQGQDTQDGADKTKEVRKEGPGEDDDDEVLSLGDEGLGLR